MHIVLMLLLLISIRSVAQTSDLTKSGSINRIDKKGLKQGKWIDYMGESGRFETFFKDNKEEGEYRFYNQNNVITEQGFYKHGKAHGLTSEFINGTLWRTRVYKNGRIVSMIIDHYANGQAKTGGNYFAGNGVILEYDSLGFVISKETYKNNKLNGPFEKYFANRQLKEKGIYQNNKYWTIEKRFDSLGQEMSFGDIKSGTGELFCYNDTSRMVKSEEYKLGKLWNVFWYVLQQKEYDNIGKFKNGNGVIKEYDVVGNLISEKTYKGGLLNGTCKYYFGDGTILLVGECINDNKEGKWLRYVNGRIRNVIDFKNNREVGIACF